MPTKVKQKPIDRLMAAMDRCAIARGEALWTNGYRASAARSEADRMHAKEMEQWKAVGLAEEAFRRLALRLLREARNAD